jgi:hypothetical protein
MRARALACGVRVTACPMLCAICSPRGVPPLNSLVLFHAWFCQAYERGVASFGFPHVKDIWIAYLTKFVKRYQAKKLERARELYEQALENVPPKDAMLFYNMYAKLEEEFGLTRHAMRYAPV